MISIQDAREQGLKRYFTGKPCPHGHIGERLVSSRCCIVCLQARTQDWRKTSKDHVREYNKKYSKAHMPRILELANIGRKNNPERTRAQKAADYQRHKPKRILTMKVYRAANPEQIREMNRAKVAANPDKYRAYGRNYKARKRKADGSHTDADIREIFFAQRGKCGYCRIKVGKKYHVDHIIALAKGGSNDRSNLQILCGPCNNGKSAKDPIDFAQSKGLLL